MSKKAGLYLMLAGAAVSAIELAKPGTVYGPDKALKDFRWEVYKTDAGKSYYLSVSDVAALVGAFIYFR